MELIRTEIRSCERTHAALSGFRESTDAIVPDAFPDIGRIICAEGAVSVKDELPQTGRILVSGVVQAVVLYQPEGEHGVRRLRVPVSFAHIEEAGGVTADSTCFVRCTVGSVTARAANSRKVSVTAQVFVETAVYEPRTETLTTGVDRQGETLELLTGEQTLPLLRQALVREFTLLDDLELPGSAGLEIVSAQCTLSQTGCQAMNGRAAVKGEARLSLLALDDAGAFQTIEQTIPFSQIVEAEPVEEGAPLSVRLAVRETDCSFAEDGVLSVGIGVRALLLQTGEQTVPVIRDLYHVQEELTLEERQLTLTGSQLLGGLQAEGTALMPLSRPAVEVIRVQGTVSGIAAADARTLRVTLQVAALYRDADGTLCGEGRQLETTVPSGAAGEQAVVHDPAVQITAAPAGEEGLRLRLLVTGQPAVCPVLRLRDLTAITPGAARTPCGGADTTLILRYIHAPELLWDLAKQYASTVQGIRRANALGEQVDRVSDAMLLIPVYSRR